MKLNEMVKSLEKLYLTEAVNHENDEINDRIRSISRKGFNHISDEDKKFLAQNGVRVRPAQTRNERPVFYGKGRSFQDTNGRRGDRHLDGFGWEASNEEGGRFKRIDPPDTRNDKIDIKGWLDTKKDRPATASEINRSLRPYSDEARSHLKRAEENEKEGRRLSLENEAEIANRLEDKDIYGNAVLFGDVEYNSDYRTGKLNYDTANVRRQRVSDMVRKQKDRKR